MMDVLAAKILSLVRQMDVEANTPVNGRHCGLVSYSTHTGQGTWERPFNDRLSKKLTELGYPCARERCYPGERIKCDLYATLPTGGHAWIEVKAAWKAWFCPVKGFQRNKRGIYEGYLDGTAGLKKSHSVAQDCEKLEKPGLPDNDFIAQLVVGFDDTGSPMLPDVNALLVKMGLASRGRRILAPEIWPDVNYPSCRICVWFWWRPVGSGRPTAL